MRTADEAEPTVAHRCVGRCLSSEEFDGMTSRVDPAMSAIEADPEGLTHVRESHF